MTMPKFTKAWECDGCNTLHNTRKAANECCRCPVCRAASSRSTRCERCRLTEGLKMAKHRLNQERRNVHGFENLLRRLDRGRAKRDKASRSR